MLLVAFLALLQACDNSSVLEIDPQDRMEESDPLLKFSSESLEFGFVEAGDTAVRTLTITHTGDSSEAPISIQSNVDG